MRHLSIRWRLTLWYALALAVILASFCAILLMLMRHQLLSRTDAALREELQELALEVRLAKSQADFDEHLRARFFQHDIYDFLVSDDRQRVVFASEGLTAAQASSLVPAATGHTLRFVSHQLVGSQAYRIASNSLYGPRGRVTVQALTPLEPFYNEMQTLQLLMLILIPIGVAFALVGGNFLAARALAPVEQIVQVAAAITISDLDRRIEVCNPHDEIGRLAITLNSLIGRLEQAVAEIQRFTADASHELRTPLTVLRAEAEAALRKVRSPEEYARTLTVVVEEATRLSALADQLLTLSRRDAGIVECRREYIRIDALLADVIDQLLPLAHAKSIAMALLAVEPGEIAGDDTGLRQAFFNILDNAIKYTPHGGRIQVDCRLKDRLALIKIADSGIGIPAEHIPRVFDRFYRVDSSRHSQTGGAGLGLAIARTAVHAHQGQIEIQSNLESGTTVTIRLPGATAADECLAATVSSGVTHSQS